MSGNDTVIAAAGYPVSDWVEIHNASDRVVDISRWGLSDSILRPDGRFPGDVHLAGRGRSSADKSKDRGQRRRALGQLRHQARGRRGRHAVHADGRILDRVITPEIPTDISTAA